MHTSANAEIGLARSSDEGLTWTRQGAVISGYDPKASTNPRKDMTGVPEPESIGAFDSIYGFLPSFQSADSSYSGPSTPERATRCSRRDCRTRTTWCWSLPGTRRR